ncbi:hypothetical protein L6250_03670 [Candidatus Parcubacteria bacterium]|nr:hypothetical protein [Candidatus Parcubacteria bacterium]
MNEKIDLNQEKLEMFYEQFGSKNFRLQSEMLGDLGDKMLDLFFKSVDFIYKMITTIGIVAGFGFTAIGYVKNEIFFTLGEVLLFSAIAIGIWTTQKIYLSERKNLDVFYSKIKSHFSERNDLFIPIFEKAQNDNLTRDDMNNLMDKDKELLLILKDNPETEKNRKDILSLIIWSILILFVAGVLLLIFSFLRIDYLLFFCGLCNL